MAKLLWLDLETTGLDPKEHSILEVAAILTDGRLQEISRYESVIHQVSPALDKMSPWCLATHSDSGLIEEVRKSGTSELRAEEELLAFITRHVQADDTLLLAGSSIHFDRSFIKERWQELDRRLHYRMLDVSSFKEAYRLYHSFELAPSKARHRAMKDIEGAISAFSSYMKLVRVQG